ncbi:MAG TPA: DNA polymerase Y family protein [Actinomycetales bacterium]|nr:DNA polymerase Y family protein [Actinomycetales bacterium]
MTVAVRSNELRSCTVWCPNWPVVAWRHTREDLDDVPVVVLDHGIVRAASREARAEQVTVGLRRREAEARCPDAVVVELDARAEAVTFELVARAVESFTPRVELEVPGRLTFPTRGPSRYFGGDEALSERIRAAVRSDGVTDVRVGIADGRFTARLAARVDAVVAPGASAEFLASRPIDTLGLPDLTGLLTRLGLRTLGAFAELAEPVVLARFGEPGARAHRWACGLDDRPVALMAPPPDLIETAELDPPAERVDVAAFAGKGLADRLLARLADRGLACSRVVVEAETEHGEHLSRCWRHEGVLTATALAERIRWQLDGWLTSEGGLSGGLRLLRLVPDEVVAATGRQLGFWGGDQAAADRADRALARVQGMLGFDAVLTAVPQGGRTPGERARWVPWSKPREPEHPVGEAAWPGVLPGPAPARVFRRPLPAELVDADGVPVVVSARGEVESAPVTLRCDALAGGGGSIDAVAGPWPHAVRWWDPATRMRGVWWQVIVGGVACLVVVERGRATVTALYD